MIHFEWHCCLCEHLQLFFMGAVDLNKHSADFLMPLICPYLGQAPGTLSLLSAWHEWCWTCVKCIPHWGYPLGHLLLGLVRSLVHRSLPLGRGIWFALLGFESLELGGVLESKRWVYAWWLGVKHGVWWSSGRANQEAIHSQSWSPNMKASLWRQSPRWDSTLKFFFQKALCK